MSFARAAFWSCSRKCLESAASPLCMIIIMINIRQTKEIEFVLDRGMCNDNVECVKIDSTDSLYGCDALFE